MLLQAPAVLAGGNNRGVGGGMVTSTPQLGGWSTLAAFPAMLTVLVAAAALDRAGAQPVADGGGVGGLCNGQPDPSHCRLFVAFCDLPQVYEPCPVACRSCIQTTATTAVPATTAPAATTVAAATTTTADTGLIAITTPGHVDTDRGHDDHDDHDAGAGGDGHHHDGERSDGAGDAESDADAHPVRKKERKKPGKKPESTGQVP